MENDEMRIQRLEEEKDKLLSLLREIVNSDMAQREEDEGNISPLINKARMTINELTS